MDEWYGSMEKKGETMAEIREETVSGFCKAQNQTRRIFCELEEDEQGKLRIVDTDCAYGNCPHTGDCLLMANLSLSD
ncbi:MAG: ubiquinone biosynthesis protein UbiE [Lachnospiraceae bacterium]|nr:ubiquinone biosynthesis protein UbiE [Lachnospiraceae bacterium]